MSKTRQKSQYKGVTVEVLNAVTYYVARCTTNGVTQKRYCRNEKEAAKTYDMIRILNNKPPKNFYRLKT